MKQLCFDFYKSSVTASQRHVHEEICRSVAKWFLENENPTGYGMGVPTRIAKIKADAAFFWSRPRRSGTVGASILIPVKTAVVVCAVSLDQCWLNCGNYEQTLEKLKALRQKMDAFEEKIRRDEPFLREPSALFEEFADWDYARSTNREYQKVRSMYNKLEGNLYDGSRFDKVAAAGIADELFLAVPAGLINSKKLFENWGILEVENNRAVNLVRRPPCQTSVSQEARIHLVQNIAAANSNAVNFAVGLKKVGDKLVFTHRPRRSRQTAGDVIE